MSWVWATLLGGVLGGTGLGVGFWIGGWLGAEIGVAVGLVVGSAVGLAVGLPPQALYKAQPPPFEAPHYSVEEPHYRAHEPPPSGVISRKQWKIVVTGGRHGKSIISGRDQHFGDDDLVRRALAELAEPGRLMFNPPNRMQLGQKVRVEVRLTRSLDLDAELLKKLQGPGKPKLEDIKTASRMAVTLTGDGFDIKRYSDEEQAVTQDGITTWEFDIRARKGGEQQLFMSVSLRFPVPGQPLVHQNVPVREFTINVRVTVPALVGVVFSDWRWATATAIAIAGVVVAVIFH